MPAQGCDLPKKGVILPFWKSFSQFQDEQFWWFRLVLRKMAEKYERHKSNCAGLPQIEYATLSRCPALEGSRRLCEGCRKVALPSPQS